MLATTPVPNNQVTSDADAVRESTQEAENLEVKSVEESRFVLNTKQFVLLNIPSGKPNRKTSYPPRITQSAQKGLTCFYYAMKVGAILEPDYLKIQGEKHRQAASLYRKSVSQTTVTYEYLREWFQVVSQKVQTQYPGVSLPQFISQSKQLFLSILEGVGSNPGLPSNVSAIYLDFSNRFKASAEQNIKTFLLLDENHAKIDNALTFLSSIGLNPLSECQALIDEYNRYFKATGIKDEKILSLDISNFESMDIHEKENLLAQVIEKHIHSIFNLEASSWKPTEPINTLFDLIKTSTFPIVFYGFFGKKYYNQEASKQPLIAHYDILGWPKGSHKEVKANHNSILHAISVIGVEKNTKGTTLQGYVYYIDPQDMSVPEQNRLIYKISYEQFCTYCSKNDTFSGPVTSTPKEVEYGYSYKRPTKS